jgi:hypothetical protein
MTAEHSHGSCAEKERGEEMADHQPGETSGTIELHFRCSDEEHERLLRRQDGRNGAAGERIGQRLDRAINSLSDEVEKSGLTIETTDGDRPPEKQRKARIPRATIERMNAIIARLPGVSRDQFVREAIRRWTKVY